MGIDEWRDGGMDRRTGGWMNRLGYFGDGLQQGKLQLVKFWDADHLSLILVASTSSTLWLMGWLVP